MKKAEEFEAQPKNINSEPKIADERVFSYNALLTEVASIALSKKAHRPMLMDLGENADLARYLFICSGENTRQTVAIAEAIESQVKAQYKLHPLATEGKPSGQWILLDYGDLIIHIFYDYVRDFYALESLWPHAKMMSVSSAQG